MTDLIPPRIITLEAFQQECQKLNLEYPQFFIVFNLIYAFDRDTSSTAWFPYYEIDESHHRFVVMQPSRLWRNDVKALPADMPWSIRELWKRPDSFPISKETAREILDHTDIEDFKLAGPKALQEIIDHGDEQITVEDAIEAYACIDLPEEVLSFVERAVLAKYNALYLYRD